MKPRWAIYFFLLREPFAKISKRIKSDDIYIINSIIINATPKWFLTNLLSKISIESTNRSSILDSKKTDECIYFTNDECCLLLFVNIFLVYVMFGFSTLTYYSYGKVMNLVDTFERSNLIIYNKSREKQTSNWGKTGILRKIDLV